jgi:DNA-binding HxlR family transcriptional regulator
MSFAVTANLSIFGVPSIVIGINLFVSMDHAIIHVTARCPIRTTLELVGGKWKLLILFQLAQKPLRLSELKRMIPDASEKMLIQELKHLLRSRLIERRNYGEVPPRVEYALAAIGQEVMPLLASMRTFAQAYDREVREKS